MFVIKRFVFALQNSVPREQNFICTRTPAFAMTSGLSVGNLQKNTTESPQYSVISGSRLVTSISYALNVQIVY